MILMPQILDNIANENGLYKRNKLEYTVYAYINFFEHCFLYFMLSFPDLDWGIYFIQFRETIQQCNVSPSLHVYNVEYSLNSQAIFKITR